MLPGWTYEQLHRALEECYRAITHAVADVDGPTALHATGAQGWGVTELLVHQLGDAQRALVTFATPSAQPADVDAVTYWRPFGAGGSRGTATDGGMAGAWWVKRTAAAFGSSFRPLAALWSETAEAVIYTAGRADHSALLATQGHVLTGGDFVATLVVEAALHHLDLRVALPGAAPTPETGLAVVRATLDGLLGIPAPAALSDEDWARLGTGRRPVTSADRALVGPGADRLPLLS